MNNNSMSHVKRALYDQCGQVLPWVTGAMLALLGMAGLTVDVGHAYVVIAQVQNCTNAAALASANSPNITGQTPTSEANQFGCNAGTANPNPYVSQNPIVTPVCLNMLMPVGSTCITGSAPNAVKVTQQASVPTYFMNVLGIRTVPIKATAFASLVGASNLWNIAIIQDATGSMATADTNCPGGSIAEFNCALNSLQTILAQVSPCPTGMTTCTPDQANVRVALFTFPNMLTAEVPKFYKNGCSSSLSSYTTPAPYAVLTLPKESATSYKPLSYVENGTTWSASYELTYNASGTGSSSPDTNGFVSDYYSPGNAVTGNLNPSSPLVELVGYGGNGGGTKTGSGAVPIGSTSSRAPCMPISPGGIALNAATVGLAGSSPVTGSTVNTVNVGQGITYYAAAIYAAQAALTAESTLYTKSQNAIIMLSDGQANTQWIYFPQGTLIPSGLTTQGKTNTSKQSTLLATGPLGYDKLNSVMSTTALVAAQLGSVSAEGTGAVIAGGTKGKYPDFFDECQQAIVAGQNAATAGTRVYTVAYGAEQSGCGTGSNPDGYNDITLVTLPSTANVPFSTTASLTPCMTMENIASSLTYFYSDYLQSGSSRDLNCVGAVNQISDLTQIAFSISSTFKNAKLLPSTAQ